MEQTISFSPYQLLVKNFWWQKRVQMISLSAVAMSTFLASFSLSYWSPRLATLRCVPLSSTFHLVLGIKASFSQTSHSSSGTPEAIPSLEHFLDPQMKSAAPVRANSTGFPVYNNYF